MRNRNQWLMLLCIISMAQCNKMEIHPNQTQSNKNPGKRIINTQKKVKDKPFTLEGKGYKFSNGKLIYSDKHKAALHKNILCLRNKPKSFDQKSTKSLLSILVRKGDIKLMSCVINALISQNGHTFFKLHQAGSFKELIKEAIKYYTHCEAQEYNRLSKSLKKFERSYGSRAKTKWKSKRPLGIQVQTLEQSISHDPLPESDSENSESDDGYYPHDKKVYNWTKRRSKDSKLINNKVSVNELQSIMPMQLEEDAKAINSELSKKNVISKQAATANVILCVALRSKKGKIKKFAFSSGKLMPLDARKEAERRKYHVIKAVDSHAEVQLIQFLHARNGYYNQMVGMGCSKGYCNKCHQIFKWVFGPDYHNLKISLTKPSGKNHKNWKVPRKTFFPVYDFYYKKFGLTTEELVALLE